MGKREEIRQKRQKEQRKQQTIVIALIVIGALLIAGVLIYPSLTPIGDISVPAEAKRPQTNGNSVGDPNAPVKVEEFSDFQCPYCKKFKDEFEPALLTNYVSTGKVYFTYTPFSFIGKESIAAAEAAYCAADQNKFWEYHDILFANQTGENIGDFSDRRLSAFAEKIGLDTKAFQSCYDSGKYRNKVTEDRRNGEKKGVQGTPYFFVNGQGPLDSNQLTAAIEAALKK